MSAFARALAWLWRAEGGYVNDPADGGGPTKWGISQRSYPHLVIRTLTQEDAAAIYRRDFWDPCRGDELPEAIAIALFDAAVNAGPQAAIRLLQTAAGTTADGLLGPKTLRAVQRGARGTLLRDFLVQRALFYGRLAKADYQKARFLTGWLNRLFDLQALLLR
jgi:lysozyme family protein